MYGAKLKKKDGAQVKAGELLAEWDPYTIPMLTEVSGVVKFGDIIEGVTMEEKVDERTGLSTKVIIDSKDVDKRPRVSIKDVEGKPRGCRLRSGGALPAAGRRAHQRDRKGSGLRRRRRRQDSARNHQNQGYHRWSCRVSRSCSRRASRRNSR